ncbi:pupal cuticle protein 27-like [Planococcus citri]|uniref:pupal cuticle protein 27-like n=1 Tax=Planococcus citri TaxID=170843 RepID=UPI0031F7769A
MIAFTVVLCASIALSTGQYQKPSKDAAILEEARYLAVNGQFGSTYKQDDGVEFKEESDGQGNRKGSYSYIDPTGQRRTVSYTAGKDGFRATGDHIPVPPVPQAPVAPVAPAATATNSIQQTGQYNPEDDYQYQDDSQSQYKPSQDYNYNNNYQFNTPNTQFQPQYNPVQFQYRSPALSGVPAAPAPAAAVPSYNQYTSSEPPHRFFPPGKLSLNRSPDGFSYTFNKV